MMLISYAFGLFGMFSKIFVAFIVIEVFALLIFLFGYIFISDSVALDVELEFCFDFIDSFANLVDFVETNIFLRRRLFIVVS